MTLKELLGIMFISQENEVEIITESRTLFYGKFNRMQEEMFANREILRVYFENNKITIKVKWEA